VFAVNYDIYIAGLKKWSEVTTVSVDKGWLLRVSWQDGLVRDANLDQHCDQAITFQFH